MKRPLAVLLLFYILGILSGQYFAFEKGTGIVLFSVAVLLFAILLYLKFRWYGILVMFLAFPAGYIMAEGDFSDDINLVSIYNNDIVAEGTVHKLKTTSEDNGKNKIYLDVFKINGTDYKTKIYTYVDNEMSKNINIGYKVAVSGEFYPLDKPMNEGAFNEFLYEKSRGNQGKIFATNIEVTDIDKNIYYYLNKVKTEIAQVYNVTLPEDEAGILNAMILGDKDYLDPEIKSNFMDVGVYHYLVISGMHMAIITGALMFVLKKFFNKRYTAIITIVFVMLYIAMTGFGVSSIRAGLVIVIYLLGDILNRKSDFLNSIIISAIIILTFNTLFLFDGGFLLTYSATLGIAILSAPVERLFHLVSRKVPVLKPILENSFFGSYLRVSVAVMLGSLPVLLFLFYKVSFLGIIANLFIAPTITVIVIYSFLLGIVGLFSLAIAQIMAVPIIIVLSFYQLVVAVFANMPIGTLYYGRISFLEALMYYSFLTAFTKLFTSDDNNFYFYKNLFYNITISILIILITINFLPQPLKISFLYVGQGDSTVISSRSHNFVVDGGGNKMKGIGNNTGIYTLNPFLNYYGINKLDAVFVTHIDSDHVMGIIEILNLKKVKVLYLPEGKYDKDNELFTLLLYTANENKVDIKYLKSGDLISVNKDFNIQVLNPLDMFESDTNKNSLVLRVNYKSTSTLLTGDIDAEVEDKLEGEFDLYSDVLKLSHHGSKNGNTLKFMETVSPKVAIVSAGKNNSYGHPNEEVLSRLEEMGVPVYETFKYGRIEIKTYGKEIKINFFR